MSLVRLTYFSAATSDLPLTEIKKILMTARENNEGIGVCGMLCYDNQYFLQTIEGERSTINELFQTIAEDPRHEDVVIVSYEYIQEAIFKDWKMGYAGSNALLGSMLAKLKLTQFEPDELTPAQCVAILKNLSKQQDEI